MPKAGETPEMGANPLLGFGRVYARPEVASIVDRRIRRLLNEPGHTFEQFHDWLQRRGHHLVGRRRRHAREHVAVRRREGHRPDGGVPPVQLAAGPVASLRVVHGLPDRAAARGRSRRPTPRCCSTTARRARRSCRPSRPPTPACAASTSTCGRCGARAAWRASARCGRSGPTLGVHLVEDGWKTPSGFAGLHRLRHLRADLPRRQLDGRRRRDARVPLRRLRRDRRGDAGRQPLGGARRRLLDGALLAHLRPAVSRRGEADAARPRLRRTSQRSVSALLGGRDVEAGKVQSYADAIRDAAASNLPLDQPGPAPGRLPAAEAVAGARLGGLHLRRPVHRLGWRRADQRRRLSRHDAAGHAARRRATSRSRSG